MTASVRPTACPLSAICRIKFTRRAATPGFEKLVGKETDRSKHSPHEYVSEDGSWVIRSVQCSGRGSTNSGRVHWYVPTTGALHAPLGLGQTYAITREDAIDEIHRRIAEGVCDGFKGPREDACGRRGGAAGGGPARAAALVRAKDCSDTSAVRILVGWSRRSQRSSISTHSGAPWRARKAAAALRDDHGR